MIPRVGNYELVRPLGHGGMAEVWLATHVSIRRLVAVKIIQIERAANETFLDAFYDEVREHARLTHPSIAAIYDYGRITERDHPPHNARVGLPYLVMEVADGSLREFMPNSWNAAKQAFRKVLGALAYAHANGVVHRDLKPENILVSGHELKLSDFGIAQAFSESKIGDSTQKAEQTAGAGTPYYMAPEQIHAYWRDFGPWTDLYAFGCMAYEVLCGKRPIEGRTMVEIAVKHVSGEFPPLDPRFELPHGVQAWLDDLVRVDPRSRFELAADALAELERLPDLLDGRTAEPISIEIAETLIDGLSDTHPVAPGPIASVPTKRSSAPRAALAADWRPDAAPSLWSGLGIFGMRNPGLVGLEDARDALWAELLASHVGLRMALVQGSENAPVDVLARWLVRRAHALGTADFLVCSHSDSLLAGEGLSGLVDAAFGLWDLPEEARQKRIRHALDGKVSDDVLELDVRTLCAESMNATDIGYTRNERYRALADLLVVRAAGRPIIVWVENAQWGDDAVHFVDYLRANHASLHALILLTVHTQQVDALSEMSLVLEELSQSIPNLEVRPFHAGEMERWIDRLLPLNSAGREQIIAQAHGDIEVAQMLLDDVIRRNGVVDKGERFEMTVVLSEAEHVFLRRLDEIAADSSDQLAAQAYLEVMAALGTGAHQEIALTLAEAGFEAPSGLDGALLDAGLIVREGTRVRFSHPRVRRAVIARMKVRGTWEDWNLACLHTLESLGVSSARLAHHADEISDPDERLRVYVAGIRDYYTTNFRLASRLAETANALAAQANDVLAKLDLRLLTGVLAHSRGEAHEAMRIVLETEKDARAQGILLMVARCNMFLVVRESDRGDFAAAAQRAEQCANIFRGLNDTRSLGSALFLMGFCLQQVNRLDESTQAYEEAATTYQSLGQMALYTMVQSYISNQLTSQGRFDEAETVARAALGIAERLGFSNSISELHLVLGELARQRFDLTSARLAYLEALKWLRICGKAATEVVELNLMMVNVADPSRKIEDQDLQRLREVFANRSNLRFIQTIEAIEDLQHGRPIREDGSNADVRWLVAVQKSRSLP